MIKKPLANAGNAQDTGLISGLGRSPGVGYGNPSGFFFVVVVFWFFFCLENPMDRGVWWATDWCNKESDTI